MHQSGLIKNIFQYLEEEEKLSSRNIKKIYISLSEFGGINEEHFKEEYKKESQGKKWESVDLEIRRIPFGPELEITQLDFE
jgi:Zn finger protein HypA/HybF involved in hydrogenase expression